MATSDALQAGTQRELHKVLAELDRTCNEIRLAHAVASARRGDLEEARLALDATALQDADQDLRACLLRAKIAAQQGDLDAATSAFHSVIQHCPDHAGAARGLAAVARLRSSRAPGWWFSPLLRGVVVLTVAALLTWTAVWAVRAHNDAASQSLLAEMAALREELDAQRLSEQRQAAELRRGLERLAAHQEASLQPVLRAVQETREQVDAAQLAHADAVQALSRQIQIASVDVREIVDRLAALTGRMDGWDSAVADREQSLMASISAMHEENTALVRAQIGDQSREVDAVNAALIQLTQTVDAAQVRTAALLAAMEASLEANADTSSVIDTLTATVSTQSSRLLAIEGSLNAAAADLQALRGAIKALDQRMPVVHEQAPAEIPAAAGVGNGDAPAPARQRAMP